MKCCEYEMLEITKRDKVIGHECSICKKKVYLCYDCGAPATKKYGGKNICDFHYDQEACDAQGRL